MKEKDRMTANLIAEFTENYPERLFYFCLKRTGDRLEAEDLASDITLNVVEALAEGMVPVSFSAWVWQIARNRYSAWAEAKRRRRESDAGTDISDCEVPCMDASTEESLIRQEELTLLRRELAFVSSDYRDIVVAYYIEDRKIRDIALSTCLPEGTVKAKLFRARKKLKEGMDMAREFGQKSFRPEEVFFAASGSQPSGLPWSALRRRLQKNILLEASNNPSTIDELAVELGTALPYMEEEVAILTEATLLRKVGEKYITDFFIVDRETMLTVYAAQRRQSETRSGLIGTIASDSLPVLRELGIAPRDMDDNTLRWWTVIALADDCIARAKGYQIEWPTMRTNGEQWGIIGFAQTAPPENLNAFSHEGNGSDREMFWRYRLDEYSVGKGRCLDYREVSFLADVIRNHRNKASFSLPEQKMWTVIENRFAHADDSGNICLDILVIYADAMAKVQDFWRSHPLYGKLMALVDTVFDETVEILRKCANPLLHHLLPYCASMLALDCRMMTVHDEVNSGRLIPPKEQASGTAAMWLYLER